MNTKISQDGSPTTSNHGLLLVHEDHNPSRPSISSLRSEASSHTIIGNNRSVEDIGRGPQRQRTYRVKVHLSRWACFLGLIFGPHKTENMAGATVEEPEADFDYGHAFDHEDCQFFRTLSVISKSEGKEWIKERCLFDTGCFHGNIISLEFATRLGYKETDFKDLKRGELEGISSSGHMVTPKAAVLLSWRHNTSPQYSNMRFLVVEDYRYGLLIGTESIVRHSLIAPPNFSQLRGVAVVQPGDKELERLNGHLKQLKDERDRIKNLWKKTRNDLNLKSELEEAKRLVAIQDKKINIYLATTTLKTNPKDPAIQGLLRKNQEDIKELQENTMSKRAVNKGNEPPRKTPGLVVQVEAPNGKMRTPTGFSMFAGKRPQSVRK